MARPRKREALSIDSIFTNDIEVDHRRILYHSPTVGLVIVHRISAGLKLRAHYIIRLWWILDVQLVKKEAFSEEESLSRPGNHNIMNAEFGRKVRPV